MKVKVESFQNDTRGYVSLLWHKRVLQQLQLQSQIEAQLLLKHGKSFPFSFQWEKWKGYTEE